MSRSQSGREGPKLATLKKELATQKELGDRCGGSKGCREAGERPECVQGKGDSRSNEQQSKLGVQPRGGGLS